MNVIYVGGYSRSGKTRSLKYFESLGIPCFSTSRVLDEIARSLKKVFELTHDFSNLPDKRINKIKLAEEVLIPSVGRDLFPVAIKNQVKSLNSKLIVIETIGGEEFELLQKYINELQLSNSIYLNIRSKEEQEGVDIRKLLPCAIDVWNDGDDTNFHGILHTVLKCCRYKCID